MEHDGFTSLLNASIGYSLSGLAANPHNARSRYTGSVTNRKMPKNAATMNHHGAPANVVPVNTLGMPMPRSTINEITIAMIVHMIAIACLVFIVISNTFTSSSLKYLLTNSPYLCNRSLSR